MTSNTIIYFKGNRFWKQPILQFLSSASHGNAVLPSQHLNSDEKCQITCDMLDIPLGTRLNEMMKNSKKKKKIQRVSDQTTIGGKIPYEVNILSLHPRTKNIFDKRNEFSICIKASKSSSIIKGLSRTSSPKKENPSILKCCQNWTKLDLTIISRPIGPGS